MAQKTYTLVVTQEEYRKLRELLENAKQDLTNVDWIMFTGDQVEVLENLGATREGIQDAINIVERGYGRG